MIHHRDKYAMNQFTSSKDYLTLQSTSEGSQIYHSLSLRADTLEVASDTVKRNGEATQTLVVLTYWQCVKYTYLFLYIIYLFEKCIDVALTVFIGNILNKFNGKLTREMHYRA